VPYPCRVLDTAIRRSERAPAPVRAAFRLWYQLHQLIRESVKFATVGSFGFVVDIAIFNALMYSGGEGPLHDKPLTAKTISVVLATLVTYTGNRHWTFRHRARTGVAREYPLFFLLNGVGLAIALGCLAVSRYVLDLSGPIADNIAANVVGLALGTLFRFWSYRRWVFPEPALP
jgi:putative flippase GtrA